ncbi:MAG: hypothetical protein KAI24_23635 [Planctomycetes bacterium]|nr:hypothetical protein [Planctomycetota bacterium]
MIRGPVLPQMRDSLWTLVSSRLDRIESGLRLVLESLDCSNGELGPVEGLARDSMGGPVLVLLAVDGDSLLPARALAAGQFLQRVGDALAGAVPEANFSPGVTGRLLLVGTESAAATIERVCALPIPGLQACTLEPFRVAGTERFAVRWIAAADGAVVAPRVGSEPVASPPPDAAAPEFIVPAGRTAIWAELSDICQRIDPAVTVHGDRYSRRIVWNGFPLGEVRTVGSALVASAATGVVRELRDARDVRRFGDQMLRAFARHAGLEFGAPDGANGTERDHDRRAADAAADRTAAARHAVGERHEVADREAFVDAAPNGVVEESLRSSLAASRLSPEEYSALGDPASLAGSSAEGSVANDRSQATPLPDSRSVGRSD